MGGGGGRIVGFIGITFVFTIVIFFAKGDFSTTSVEGEESYIDYSIYTQLPEQKKDTVLARNKEILIEDKNDTDTSNINILNVAKDIHIIHDPEDYFNAYSQEFTNILEANIFMRFISTITLAFFEEKIDVRGKMKDQTIKLFSPDTMKNDEIISVFIHEYAHYIDIYFLERTLQKDTSNIFYDISWHSTIIINEGLNVKDFVSGYAMTNKYEDFAESMGYYVFHNEDFLDKTLQSDILLQKYNFLRNYIFIHEEFIGSDFSYGLGKKDYYWDITKIGFSRKNFLQYVKKSI